MKPEIEQDILEMGKKERKYFWSNVVSVTSNGCWLWGLSRFTSGVSKTTIYNLRYRHTWTHI